MREDSRIRVPVWEQYSLTVQEAAVYFRLGEKKIRNILDANRQADFILMNGNRTQIKRRKFEEYLDRQNAV